jgi:hypothetical protein
MEFQIALYYVSKDTLIYFPSRILYNHPRSQDETGA